MKLVYFVVLLISLSFVYAVGYDNPDLYGIRPAVVTTTTTGNGSINVSAINHFDLNPASLFWAVADHTMDDVLDMLLNAIINATTIETENIEVSENITLTGFITDDELNVAGVLSRTYWNENGTYVIRG